MRTPLRLWVILATLVTLFAVSAGAEQPVRTMPKYRVRGDVVDDPVQLNVERKAFQAAFEAYKLAAKEFRDEVREFIAREVSSRQKSVSSGYQSQIDALDKQQFDLRREAIARLESFIFRHRDHEQYTPDTMFRLAELYYEDTIASYNRSQDDFNREMGLYNRGKLLDPPTESERDFSRSIAIYKYLHWVPEGTQMSPLAGKLQGVVLEARWPNYKFADAAMYLQGYCEFEGGEVERAIASLSKIEQFYPNSQYVAEAWLRVGEMYFDDSNFEAAADAYGRAAKRAEQTGDHKNYSLALYKLGWSNFQLYRYPEAVRWFQKLIEFEDNLAAKATKGKDQLDLRKEAIEYLAKSLAEPSWDEDGCDDFGNEDAKSACLTLDPRLRPRLYVASVLAPDFTDFPNWQSVAQGDVLTRLQANFNARQAVRKDLINGKPYIYDILLTYGNTLLEQALDDYYRQGILVLGYVVDHWPQARESQASQRKIIRAVDILAGAALNYQALLAKGGLSAAEQNTAKLGLEMAMADQERQVVERRKYLSLFAKGTPWYEKWGGDKDLAAQVDDTINKVRLDFARLMHQQAQTLRAAGEEDAALAKYIEASKEYEVLLLNDLEAPGAYELAWTVAETQYFAGKRCDALRTKENELLTDPKSGALIPYPVEAVPALKGSCEQMRKSIKYYTMVRDWKGQKGKGEDGKPLDYTEEAGFTAILSSSQVLNARAALPVNDPEYLESRMIPELRPSNAQDEADIEAMKDAIAVQRVPRQTIDPVATEWLLAVDGYIAAGQFNREDPERAQRLALQAAELLYKNRNYDPWPQGVTPRTTAGFWSARERFWWIIEKFPVSKQAISSIQNLLTSFAVENDIEGLQMVTKYMEEHPRLGDPTKIDETKKKVALFKLGVLARDAENLYGEAEKRRKAAEASTNPDEAGKQFADAREYYDKAGDKYRNLRADAKDTKTKLGALMWGMESFRQAEKWDKCFDVLKEAEEMIRSVKDADEAERKENLKRLDQIVTTRAKLNYRFFRIPEAIADYRLLYETDPNGQYAAEYLKSAADLASYNSNWDLAVQLDKEYIARYSGDVKKRDTVRTTAWRIQQSWQKKGDIDRQVEALEEFIARYTTDKLASNRVFQAYSMIGEIYESRGDEKNADKIWRRIIDAFNTGGYAKNGGPEATSAAQATFKLMVPRYQRFMATKIVANPKLSALKQAQDLQNQVKAMMDIVAGPEKKTKKPDGTVETSRGGGMFDEYKDAVAGYGSRDWSYAAYLYRGQMLVFFAKSIYGAPTPENMSPDEEEEYLNALEQFGKPIEDQALRSFVSALSDAESKGVVNQWVTELRKAVNRYKPKEYPLLKDEKRLVADPAGTLLQPDRELR